MSCVGGFREGEIDGKPFLIFTLLTQPDHLSSSSSSSGDTTTVSGGNNDLLQPLFICHKLRAAAEYLKGKEMFDSDAPTLIPMSISPHFPTTRSGDQHVQLLLASDRYEDLINSDDSTNVDIHGDICKLPLVPLFWCHNQESADGEFECRVCRTSDRGTNYYFCVSCGEKYHKECVESPFHIKHPSYPFLSFQLSYYTDSLKCICCQTDVDGLYYYSPASEFDMHPLCMMKPIPFVLDHPKRHPHPLSFFPKQYYLPCNVCGSIHWHFPTYLCVQCVFVAHQDCAYSPNVIRISRHHHRISFTSFLPSGEWSCRVCRKKVDNHYSAYSCNRCDDYFVHTRCALREDLWDGVELEGVPEEPEVVVEPFERIADGIILHFSHDHLLKLEINRVGDKDKFCQACVLPIKFEDEFYSCLDQCDFILHEACVNAARNKHNPLHAHPLTLKVVTNQYQYAEDKGYFDCDACRRKSCGFVYTSDRGSQAFELDIRCAMVSEPFEYQGHEHPLFLALTEKEQKGKKCQICQRQRRYTRKLNCIKCAFVICFECATLPHEAWYKHDKHLLTFQKEKEASDESGWCELCEKELVYSEDGGYYSCDDCCTTLHVDCLLGKDPYMRPGQTIMIDGKEIHIVRNNTMSRPFCQGKSCGGDRCPYGVVFQKENKTFCSPLWT